jgi:hypothetical protein
MVNMFKQAYEEQWSRWFREKGHKQYTKTGTGNRSKATKEEVNGWIANSLVVLAADTIRKCWETTTAAPRDVIPRVSKTTGHDSHPQTMAVQVGWESIHLPCEEEEGEEKCGRWCEGRVTRVTTNPCLNRHSGATRVELGRGEAEVNNR